MTLGIHGELAPGPINGGLLANAGEYVGERPPVGVMIEHIIDRDQRDASSARMIFQPNKARAVAAAVNHGGSKADAMRRSFTQACEKRGASRHRDQLEPEGMCQQVIDIKSAGAFLGAQIADSRQSGKSSPTGTIAWIGEDVRRAVGEHKSRTGMVAQRQSSARALPDVRARRRQRNCGRIIRSRRDRHAQPAPLGLRGARLREGKRKFEATANSR